MKKVVFAIFIIVSIYIGYCNRFDIYSFIINITGEIKVSDEISKNIKPNSMLYITIKNDKNIIFAIKEIINPVFPLKFKINRKNVLYPDISSFKVKIETTINTHGEVGKTKTGDFYSTPINATIFSRNLNPTLDKTRN